MATTTKELLQRTDIRTMKKDMKNIGSSDRSKKSMSTLPVTPKAQAPIPKITETKIVSPALTEPPKEKNPIEIKEVSKPKEDMVKAEVKPTVSSPKENVIQQQVHQPVATNQPKQETSAPISKDSNINPQISQTLKYNQAEKIENKKEEVPPVTPITKPPQPATEKPSNAQPATSPQNNFPEKAYLKNVPLAEKEKLKATAEIENKQRVKFMEDVEKWASSSEKSE